MAVRNLTEEFISLRCARTNSSLDDVADPLYVEVDREVRRRCNAIENHLKKPPQIFGDSQPDTFVTDQLTTCRHLVDMLPKTDRASCNVRRCLGQLLVNVTAKAMKNRVDQHSWIDDMFRINDTTVEDEEYHRLLRHIDQGFDETDIATLQIEEEVLRSRGQDIRLLTDELKELHQMFIDMKTMLDDQTQLFDKIEDNVTDTHEEMKASVQELKSAEHHQKKANVLNRMISALLVAVGIGGGTLAVKVVT